MSKVKLRWSVIGVGLFVTMVAFVALSPMSQAGRGVPYTVQCCPPGPCNPCDPPAGTVFAAGTDPENLQVHVVGPDFGILEIYFRNEFARDFLPGASNLHCDYGLTLAPQNPFGTFAVRYGANKGTFKVYGWKKNETAAVSYGPVTPEPGYPVCLHWVTPRILKVTYGADRAKTLILRFNDSDTPWTVLFQK